MKIKTSLLTIVAALLWAAVPACSSELDNRDTSTMSSQSRAENISITWYGYDEGLSLGKENGKKILINFYTDWCHYCKKMDKEIYTQTDSADYINRNFIPIRINSEIEKQLTAVYQVSGFPTTWFLDQDGEKIMKIPGYVPKKMFMSYLEFFQTDSYQNMSFREFMRME